MTAKIFRKYFISLVVENGVAFFKFFLPFFIWLNGEMPTKLTL